VGRSRYCGLLRYRTISVSTAGRLNPPFDRQPAIYVQDEIKLARRVIINAGLRYDGYEDFLRVTPRAALIVMLSTRALLETLRQRSKYLR
jgi:outer membrane receptor for monomeric catechols